MRNDIGLDMITITGTLAEEVPPPRSHQKSYLAVILGVSLGAGGLIIILVMVIIFLLYQRKTPQNPSNPQEDGKQQELAQLVKEHEFKDVEVKHKLGEGSFGAVYYGVCLGTPVPSRKK